MMKSLARSALCALITVPIRLGSPLGKKLSSRKTGELLCLSGETGFRFYGAAVYSSKSHKCFEKPPFLWLFETQVASRRKRRKESAKFDLHAKPRYSLIRKRDWRSGSALRSHRRGHWFEPSITHQRTPVSRNGGFIVSTPAHPPQRLLNPADRSAAPPRERQPRHGPTTNEVPP